MIAIQDLKKGDFFKRKEGAKKVYTRDEFCRYEKKYTCTNYEDIADYIYLKKNTKVFTDFEY